MFKQTITVIALAGALAFAAGPALARGGGGGGHGGGFSGHNGLAGGFDGVQGGGSGVRLGGGGLRAVPSDRGRAAFGAAHEAGGRVAALGNGGGGATSTARGRGRAAHAQRGHAHFHGRRAFLGYPFYDSYYDDGCYRLVHVRTRNGLRWQRENVCY